MSEAVGNIYLTGHYLVWGQRNDRAWHTLDLESGKHWQLSLPARLRGNVYGTTTEFLIIGSANNT
jgi:hypothetical protein